MTATKHGVVGWPRPRAQCDADTEAIGYREFAVRQGRPTTRAVPWLAAETSRGWDPWGFDCGRASAMRERDLCQVCGEQRQETVYAIASLRPGARLRDVAMYGSAVCSVRCARLTAAVCPHYVEQWPVGIFPVPNDGRVALSCDEANDEEFDLTNETPVSVIGEVA